MYCFCDPGQFTESFWTCFLIVLSRDSNTYLIGLMWEGNEIIVKPLALHILQYDYYCSKLYRKE